MFGYVGFARESVLHHLDPYTHGWAAALHHDPIRPYIQWHDVKSAYGPLFTVASYVLVPLGIAGAMWTFKAIAFVVQPRDVLARVAPGRSAAAWTRARRSRSSA